MFEVICAEACLVCLPRAECYPSSIHCSPAVTWFIPVPLVSTSPVQLFLFISCLCTCSPVHLTNYFIIFLFYPKSMLYHIMDCPCSYMFVSNCCSRIVVLFNFIFFCQFIMKLCCFLYFLNFLICLFFFFL